MSLAYKLYKAKTHRLIPSRYPTVSPFDWAQSAKEIEELALLEGLTNDRLKNDLGHIHLVPQEDWVTGEGATLLMAAFTHPGPSRFTDGSFGIYYAANSLRAAVTETKFHRERFLQASNEAPCPVQMREYIAYVKKKLVDISDESYKIYLDPDINAYAKSQQFGNEIRQQREWGLIYPSVRQEGATCFAILRPPALTIPTQGRHLQYIWDGNQITETNILSAV